MDPVIALDIGTSNCRAAVFRDGQVELIPVSTECLQIPSMVTFTEGKTFVGLQAKELWEKYPTATVFGTEALNSMENSKCLLKEEMKAIPFEIEEEDGTKIRTGERTVKSERITRLLIEQMVDHLRNYLRTEITSIVLCVPPCTTLHRRRILRDAASSAGYRVERFTHSIGSSLIKHYFSHEDFYKDKQWKILVLDVGANQTTAALAEINDGMVDVSPANEIQKGGDWLTFQLFHILAGKLPVPTEEVYSSPSAVVRLHKIVEELKKRLRIDKETVVSLNGVIPGIDINAVISRRDIFDISEDLKKELKKCVRNCLNEQGTEEKIDEILLIGGSSSLPIVRSFLEHTFPGKRIILPNDSDSIAVAGASIVGSLYKKHASTEKLLLMDKMNISIGHGEKTDLRTLLRPRHAPLSSSVKKSVYFPLSSNDKIVKFFEEKGNERNFLGFVDLATLETEDRNNNHGTYEVALDILSTGELNLTISSKETSVSLPISSLTQKEILEMREKMRKREAEEEEKRRREEELRERREEAERFSRSVERMAARGKLEITLTEREIATVNAQLAQFNDEMKKGPEGIERGRKRLLDNINQMLKLREEIGANLF